MSTWRITSLLSTAPHSTQHQNKILFIKETKNGKPRAVPLNTSYTWNFDKEKGQKIEELRKKYPQTCLTIFHNQKDANKFIEEIKEINNHAI